MIPRNFIVKMALVYTFFCPQIASAAEPNSCVGKWDIKPIEDNNYFNLPFKRYPINLEITSRHAIFTDNFGDKCMVLYFKHPENDELVFRGCLSPSTINTLPTHFSVRCEGRRLLGDVRGFWKLYEIEGSKKE